MKNHKILMFVNIVLIIYIFSLTIGYSFFSEVLTINGVASTVEFYEGKNLPVSPIVRDTKNNYFFTSTFDEGYLLSYESESWEEDTYTLNIDKSLLLAYEGKEITYTISFKNPTVLDYTNGYISTEVIGSNSDIVSTNGLLSTLEVTPDGVVDVSFTIKVDKFNDIDTSAKATITYTLQNQTRYLNFVINYNAADYVNLINYDLMLENSNITKIDEGYIVNVRPAHFHCSTPFLQDLKSKLKPGVKYEIIRDYQGNSSRSGSIALVKTSALDGDPTEYILWNALGIGVKKTTFTLTQEQIDSIKYIYIYGETEYGLFKYIIIREVKE